MLTIGTLMLVIGFLTTYALLSLQYEALGLSALYASVTLSVVIMSADFEGGARLLKLKITGELRRLMVELRRNQIRKTESRLAYVKQLMVEDGADGCNIRLLVLEAMIAIHTSKLDTARGALEEASRLANRCVFIDFERETEHELKHLEVHEAAASIAESVK